MSYPVFTGVVAGNLILSMLNDPSLTTLNENPGNDAGVMHLSPSPELVREALWALMITRTKSRKSIGIRFRELTEIIESPRFKPAILIAGGRRACQNGNARL